MHLLTGDVYNYSYVLRAVRERSRGVSVNDFTPGLVWETERPSVWEQLRNVSLGLSDKVFLFIVEQVYDASNSFCLTEPRVDVALRMLRVLCNKK